MANNNLMNNALADALKDLMVDKPFNKITVKMITDSCGVTRHTFYNHFEDKYHLLRWIYEKELTNALESDYTMNNWKKGIETVVDYTYKHHTISMNACKNTEREYMEPFLYATFHKAVSLVVEDIMISQNRHEIKKEAIASFYAYGLTGEFIHWIHSGFKEDTEDLKKRMFYILDSVVTSVDR